MAAVLVGPTADFLLSRTHHVWAFRELIELVAAYLFVLPAISWVFFRAFGVRLAAVVSLLGMVLLPPACRVLHTTEPHPAWQYSLASAAAYGAAALIGLPAAAQAKRPSRIGDDGDDDGADRSI
jgi:hypothetical protein